MVVIASDGCIIVINSLIRNNMDCDGTKGVTHDGLRRYRGEMLVVFVCCLYKLFILFYKPWPMLRMA